VDAQLSVCCALSAALLRFVSRVSNTARAAPPDAACIQQNFSNGSSMMRFYTSCCAGTLHLKVATRTGQQRSAACRRSAGTLKRKRRRRVCARSIMDTNNAQNVIVVRNEGSREVGSPGKRQASCMRFDISTALSAGFVRSVGATRSLQEQT
jgi:hypothetical protein